MAKLKNSAKKFGRCRVEGHGQWCEVSDDIQSHTVSRTTEKFNFIRDEMECSEQVEPLLPYCTNCQCDTSKLVFTKNCNICGCNLCVNCAKLVSYCYCFEWEKDHERELQNFKETAI